MNPPSKVSLITLTCGFEGKVIVAFGFALSSRPSDDEIEPTNTPSKLDIIDRLLPGGMSGSLTNNGGRVFSSSRLY